MYNNLLTNAKTFIQNCPELKQILEQFDIDEESYFEALNEMKEEDLVNTQPLANSTYLGG